MTLYAFDYARPQGPVRDDCARYRRLPGYYDNFIALVRELRPERWRDARVLGTLDHQVYVWWTAFQHKIAYTCDPWYSTIDDDETERRLLAALLRHNKCQVSRTHHRAPIEDYAPIVQKRIREASATEGWIVAIPTSELQHLQLKFERLDPGDAPFALPDVVVLTATDRAIGLEPPREPPREEIRQRGVRGLEASAQFRSNCSLSSAGMRSSSTFYRASACTGGDRGWAIRLSALPALCPARLPGRRLPY